MENIIIFITRDDNDFITFNNVIKGYKFFRNKLVIGFIRTVN
ncbi:hypothetical protein BSF41_45900 [Flavobacterium sp. ACN2]|nr:hypothetical protein BSF41_45900 [Flavobacterium sp. ACN2]